jgi:hypothetical protein
VASAATTSRAASSGGIGVTLPARFGGKPQQRAAWRLLPG